MSNHITGHTGLLCLLGSPVAHSVSPEMHNEACSQLGLDYTYLAFDVPEEKMPQAVEGLRTMGARGWNITMPGKNIMCKLAYKVSPASEISGACNTIVNDDGVLTAYTTDGVGFMRAVAENGVDIIGKKMTLLGAGGAATAILVQAALDGVAEINVFNVKDAFYPRAEEIVKKLNERTGCKVTLHDYSDSEILRQSIADSAILVNGTSVGMAHPGRGAGLHSRQPVFPGGFHLASPDTGRNGSHAARMAHPAGASESAGHPELPSPADPGGGLCMPALHRKENHPTGCWKNASHSLPPAFPGGTTHPRL